jgi:hypothetical protein
MHERTGDRRAGEEALKAYRRARAMWARVAERAKGVYAADLSASDRVSERGQWVDRLPAMDQDIAALEQRLVSAKPAGDARLGAAIVEALGWPRRQPAPCDHQPPAGFRPREAVELRIAVRGSLASARLYYRHVNQAERFQAAEMEAWDNVYRARIPADYTDSPYPLQYYFELKEGPERAWLYPGFAADLSNQPYFVLGRT